MHTRIALTVLALTAAAATPVLHADNRNATATPIKHVVVLFPENRSFDHYFGTYPRALNLPGEPRFEARPNTPPVNGFTDDLLFRNSNTVNPIRLGPAEIVECSQTHAYTSEQLSANGGAMDKFVENDGAKGTQAGPLACDPNMVMGYFDGNTVTALWNYAQHYALSDNSFGTNWGSSAVGAINLVSGQTHGASIDHDAKKADVIAGTVIGNPRPLLEDCSPASTNRITLTGKNIGDLMNARGITWGWFNGGFRAARPGDDKCTASHPGSNGLAAADYIPHHEPFQYYPSTANPHHVAPSSLDAIGSDGDGAHHQYDLDQDFWPAAESGHLPEVSFIKPPAFQEGTTAIPIRSPSRSFSSPRSTGCRRCRNGATWRF
jgi:phospholipase C